MSELSILQIAHDHPDWMPGGTEIVAHDLARALDAREGVASRLLVASTALHRPGALPGGLQAVGEDLVLHTGGYDRFSMLRQDGDAWLASLERVLARVRPDVVHLHGLDRLGAEMLPALRRLAPRARIVLTLHDYQLICANDGLMLTTTEGARCEGAQADRCRRCFPEITAARHALRRAHLHALIDAVDALVAPSLFLRDRFVDWGIAAARLHHLPNAVACAPAAALEAPRARRDRFAFFGNIASHKGPLVLLDAAARLRREGAELNLTLHGGLGFAEAEFRTTFGAALANAEPLARHLGPYARSEALQLMQGTDWIVVPSLWWENAPLVIAEARAAGRPVICSGIGGMAEHVRHGIDGLHVPPGDAAALAETLRAAAADPALWTRLAGAAVPAPDHAAFVDDHLALYARLRERVPA